VGNFPIFELLFDETERKPFTSGFRMYFFDDAVNANFFSFAETTEIAASTTEFHHASGSHFGEQYHAP
jgi:hypothetical protein